VYYVPRVMSDRDLALMRAIDALHLDFPFAGARMLRRLLRAAFPGVGRRHIGTLMRHLGIAAICTVSSRRKTWLRSRRAGDTRRRRPFHFRPAGAHTQSAPRGPRSDLTSSDLPAFSGPPSTHSHVHDVPGVHATALCIELLQNAVHVATCWLVQPVALRRAARVPFRCIRRETAPPTTTAAANASKYVRRVIMVGD
jgi:hypothetical protein